MFALAFPALCANKIDATFYKRFNVVYVIEFNAVKKYGLARKTLKVQIDETFIMCIRQKQSNFNVLFLFIGVHKISLL